MIDREPVPPLAAGGFAYSWAADGSYIELDYGPLTIRLLPEGAVQKSAVG